MGARSDALVAHGLPGTRRSVAGDQPGHERPVAMVVETVAVPAQVRTPDHPAVEVGDVGHAGVHQGDSDAGSGGRRSGRVRGISS